MTFTEIYQQRCSVVTDIHEHLPTLHDHASIGNAVIIELGVRSGESTFAFLAAIEAHGGTLWSCDTDAPRFLPNVSPVAPFWTFVQGDDLSRWSEAPNDVDVVFIDTSHTYNQTVAELDLYSLKVKPGGVILLHDTELETPAASPPYDPPFPVRAAAEEFAADNGWPLDLIAGCNGLGILRKPE